MSSCTCNYVTDKFLEACKCNSIEDVKACIRLKVDVNVKTKDGKNFGLLYAAEKNYPELCNVLLECPNIDANSKGEFNRTAFFGLVGKDIHPLQRSY